MSIFGVLSESNIKISPRSENVTFDKTFIDSIELPQDSDDDIRGGNFFDATRMDPVNLKDIYERNKASNDQNELESTLNDLKSVIDDIKSDTENIKDEIETAKSITEDIKSDTEEIKSELETVSNKVKSIDVKQGRIIEKLEEFEIRFVSLYELTLEISRKLNILTGMKLPNENISCLIDDIKA